MPNQIHTGDITPMTLNEPFRRKLTDLHKALLRLHKTLMDDERKEYEKVNGPIATSGAMLNLVMFDPFFDWLHRISESIVKIDELLEDEETTNEDASEFLSNVRMLFQASANESEFMVRYKAVLQREPGAVLGHMEVQRLLLPDA